MDETESGPLLEPHNVRPNVNRSDSDTDSGAAAITCCCLILCGLLVAPCFLVITAIWRGVIPPACYIEKLHILPVHGTSNETRAASVYFDLIFMDMYAYGKIYCETVTMGFNYQGNNISLPIGNISIPKFEIEKNYPTYLHINQTLGLNSEYAAGLIDVKHGSTKIFGITLNTKFRTSGMIFTTPGSKIYLMGLQANVTVNDQGMSVQDKVWLSPAFRTDLLSILQYIAMALILTMVLYLLCLCCCGSYNGSSNRSSSSRPMRSKLHRFYR